jgi:hypothetical protein
MQAIGVRDRCRTTGLDDIWTICTVMHVHGIEVVRAPVWSTAMPGSGDRPDRALTKGVSS